MVEQKPKRDWDALLAAAPDEALGMASNDLPLPDPKALEAEEALGLALLQPLAPVPFWSRLFSWFSGPLLVPATLACVVVIGLRLAPVAEVLTCKGEGNRCAQSLKKQGISLQIGLWDPNTAKVKRVRPGAAYVPTQYVLFGFQIHLPKAFVYLCLERSKGEIELLFSPVSRGGLPWPKGFHELRAKGKLQRLPLRKERGTIQLVVFATKTPLKRQALHALLRGKGLAKRLRKTFHNKTKGAFDVVTLYMQKTP